MSATEEIELLKKIIEMQASRIEKQEVTIKEHCSGLIDTEKITVEDHPELPV